MSIPQTYDFIDYLVAKKNVDDRSLNRNVWGRLQRALADHEAQEQLRVLEIGSGIGTMIERMAAGPLMHRSSLYTAVDINPDCTRAARRRLSRWAKRLGFAVIREKEASSSAGGWGHQNSGELRNWRCICTCCRSGAVFFGSPFGACIHGPGRHPNASTRHDAASQKRRAALSQLELRWRHRSVAGDRAGFRRSGHPSIPSQHGRAHRRRAPVR